MSELEDDLRATAASIAVDADRLVAIEEEKRGLDSSDPKLLALSLESERIVKGLVPHVVAERVLATESQS